MRDLNDKVTSGTLTASEWNDIPSELQAIIEDLGIVLSGADLRQLFKAITTMTHASTFYAGGGAADVYTAVKIGAKEGLHTLIAIADGALVRFVPAVNNTGASTLNVNGLGVKDITREDASALVSGDLLTTRDAWVRWDQGADDWLLQDFALPTPPINGAHLTRAASQVTTSGSVKDFTGIPSFVKRITIMFQGVSLTGASDNILVRIGDAGGFETSSYTSESSAASTSTATNGFIMRLNSAGRAFSGMMVLTELDDEDWTEFHTGRVGTSDTIHGGGSKTLSPGPLTQVSVLLTGGSFDAGQVSLMYE